VPHPPPSHPVATPDDAAAEGRIIEEAATAEQYCRVITPEPCPTEETEDVCGLLRECLDLRAKWCFTPAAHPADAAHPEAVKPSDVPGPRPFEWDEGGEPGPAPHTVAMVDGVFRVTCPDTGARLFAPPGDANAFFSDMHRVLKIAATGPVKTHAHHRLNLLEQKFNLHVMLNADKEFLAQKSAPHRDLYNVRKVDTHVHHSACMHQKHLLRFIKSKLRKEPDEVMISRGGGETREGGGRRHTTQ
jgi:AMP deaminase